MYKVGKIFLFTLLFLTVGLSTGFSQKKSRMMTFNAEDGEITILQGIGAILREDNGSLVVEMLPPKNHLPEEYNAVDLKQKDVIFMCNGKKVKTIAEFNAIIDKLEFGDEIQLGIKRGKDRLMTSLPKADPGEGGGKMMMMTKTIGGDDGGVETEITMDGEGDVTFLECGIILKDEEGKAVVVTLMPNFTPAEGGEKPEKGDVLISINDQSSDTADGFLKLYNKIEDDAQVSFVFKRSDKSISTTIVKKPMDGEVIITK